MIDGLVFKDILTGIRCLFHVGAMAKKVKRGFIYYCYSPINIILYGESGTGKSQLANSLAERVYFKKERTRGITKIIFTLPNGRRVQLFDSPGHETYETIRQDLGTLITKGKVKGIINVVSYGYCESDTAEDVDVFRNGTTEVKEEYLTHNRQREIKQIDDWFRYVKGDKLKWIITLINKSDIWHHKRTEVLRHYESGDYYNKLHELRNCCVLHTFEYCSIISPFYEKPMTLSIGEKHKNELQTTFKNELLNLITDNGKL